MPKRFYVLRAHITDGSETYAIENEHHYYHTAQEEADALNDREERNFIEYFVSQYRPEDMP